MTCSKSVLGWQEWVGLPDLNIGSIKAKIDTGAKTCALHTYFIEPYKKGTENWVKFCIHPVQDDVSTNIECHAKLVDERNVTDSGGHSELRYVIQTKIIITGEVFEAEVTLTDRESMKFRMLLGRNALKRRFIVDSSKSFLSGKGDTENSSSSKTG